MTEAIRKKKSKNKLKLPKPPRTPTPKKEPYSKYYPFPTSTARKAIGYGNIAAYTQHRMQDKGRSIAMGTNRRERFILRQEDTWTFQQIMPNSKIYIVTWNGLGQPPARVSSTSFSQGKDYTTKQNITKHLEGKPDQYTWAVWFLVNGIPPETEWPPVPSKNPGWTMEPIWPEYPLPQT